MAVAPPGSGSSEEALSFLDGGTGTAFADIVFLLLAFLISVFSLKAAMDLPDSHAGQAASAQAGAMPLRIGLQDGEYVLSMAGEHHPVSDPAVMAQVFHDLARGQGTLMVELSADAATPFAIVRSVMTAAQNAGFSNLSILARHTQQQP